MTRPKSRDGTGHTSKKQLSLQGRFLLNKARTLWRLPSNHHGAALHQDQSLPGGAGSPPPDSPAAPLLESFSILNAAFVFATLPDPPRNGWINPVSDSIG